MPIPSRDNKSVLRHIIQDFRGGVINYDSTNYVCYLKVRGRINY